MLGRKKTMFKLKQGNVYTIDTKMFGFPHYQSCYLVKGDELVMVDTGLPTQLDTVRKGIASCGFSVRDISKIILTHCEHPDHAGNVGAFVQENPDLQVYIHPAGLEYLTNPSTESEARKKVMLPQMAARFGEQVPVPASRVRFLRDGQVLDIGKGTTLRVQFTPGHQPSGLILFDDRQHGLFINDLVGNYFADADFSLVLTPPRSDPFEMKRIIESLVDLPLEHLYLGHFGIVDDVPKVFSRTLEGIQRILDIATTCFEDGKTDDIEGLVLNSKMPELEKLKATRGMELYEYTKKELITHHSTYFAGYCMDKF